MKRKQIKKRIQKKNYPELFKTSVKKTEFWTGIIAVIIFTGIVNLIIYRQLAKKTITSPVIINKATPVPTLKTTVSGNAMESIVNNPMEAKVEKDGDSYWTISQRTCGTGRYFESIAALNGYRPLYLNDTVKVRCSE
ncbi:hypothetical protein GYA28_03260 [Candidatus Roizmanbacteria bacterium]|jgi:hypothetical protein|nr:hypothetical protein [Candidatus Roizmanbacteria bacterium]